MTRIAPTTNKGISSEIRTATEFYNQQTSLYVDKFGSEGRKQVAKWNHNLKQIKDNEALLDTLKLYFSEMVRRLKDVIPDAEPEQKEEDYDLLTLNDRRTIALQKHMERTGKKVIKTSEAKIVLETIEHRRLSRSQVLRAVKGLVKLVHGVIDKIGGRCEVRFILKDPASNTKKSFFNRSDYRKMVRFGV